MKDAWRASPAAMMSRLTERRFQWPDHVEYLSRRLTEGVLRGGARVIICEPPGHGKSELMSHWLPVWFFEHFPHLWVLLAGYGSDFAAEWGAKVRDSIREHVGSLKVRIDPTKAAENNWRTTVGGGMVTAGYEAGGFTGRRGNLILIDDPIKNETDAFSPTYREKIWRWWDSVVSTRLYPDTSIFITHTRWHPDDLIGRLLKEQEAGKEQWELINLPAMAEPGDLLGRPVGAALWPEQYPLSFLEKVKAFRGSWVWSALYQQRPVLLEGGFLKREWFNITDRAPANFKNAVRHWDLAATEATPGTDPDYTVGLKMCETDNGSVFITDIVRVRREPNDVEKLVKQVARLDQLSTPVRMEKEPGASGKSLIDYYSREILPAFDFKGVPATGDKVTRATPFAAAAQRGDVFLVNGPWVQAFLDEATSFPSKKKDQIDAASAAFQFLKGDAEPWDRNDFNKLMNPASLRKKKSPMDLLRSKISGG